MLGDIRKAHGGVISSESISWPPCQAAGMKRFLGGLQSFNSQFEDVTSSNNFLSQADIAYARTELSSCLTQETRTPSKFNRGRSQSDSDAVTRIVFRAYAPIQNAMHSHAHDITKKYPLTSIRHQETHTTVDPGTPRLCPSKCKTIVKKGEKTPRITRYEIC